MHENNESEHLLEICFISFKNHILIIGEIFNNLEKDKITVQILITYFDQLNNELHSLYSELLH